MKQSHTDEDIEKVKEKAIQQGHEPLVINGVERSVVAVSGKVNDDHRAVMKLLPNVSRVIPVGKPYKLASKNYKKENSIIQIKNLTIGGDEIAIIAGPDSAETQEQTIETAMAAKDAGSNGFVAPGSYPGPAILSYVFTNSTSLLIVVLVTNDVV